MPYYKRPEKRNRSPTSLDSILGLNTGKKEKVQQCVHNLKKTDHSSAKHLDANGIVIGEYGFLTADGYYQTVMYATDKEGRFLITGRKRVRVTPRKFHFMIHSNI